ncbi:hypothetical protein Tco_1000311 [Tanacetum coccineum]
MKTPMSSDNKLTKDEECESVDSTKCQGMIGNLLYLKASRSDIMFSVCLCARFQEAPKTSNLEAVKRIFRYIKGTKHLGLWYPKGTDIETVVYADSDHAGDYVDQKSTSGICTFVGCCLKSWFSKKQTALAISTTEAEYLYDKNLKTEDNINNGRLKYQRMFTSLSSIIKKPLIETLTTVIETPELKEFLRLSSAVVGTTQNTVYDCNHGVAVATPPKYRAVVPHNHPLPKVLQISDVCRPFGSDGSFRNWHITAAYNKDTIKMADVSRTFESEVAITAAYDSGSLAKQ